MISPKITPSSSQLEFCHCSFHPMWLRLCPLNRLLKSFRCLHLTRVSVSRTWQALWGMVRTMPIWRGGGGELGPGPLWESRSERPLRIHSRLEAGDTSVSLGKCWSHRLSISPLGKWEPGVPGRVGESVKMGALPAYGWGIWD